ncbi:MAG: amidohydrolase family protein [Betaproteobacteria bacterium]|nr:amidohydrolase family protein [Betaproteobacteria bacterium]
MIIDCRCRLTLAGEADYFYDRVRHAGQLARVPALGTQTIEAFFAELDAAGVTTAVSVSGCNPGAKLGRFELPARTSSNDAMAEVQAAYPGRFIGVAGIDVSNQKHDAMSELRRCVEELGLFAVFIEPGRAPGCNLDDPLLYPLYAYCEAKGVTLIPQTSGLLGGKLLDYANPRYIEKVASDFPGLNIICGHGCYPYVREAIVMACRYDNVWLAPDSYLYHLGHADWLQAVNFNALGFASRFVFSSAYPLNALAEQVTRFRELAWAPEQLPKLFCRNALSALRLADRPAFRDSPQGAQMLGLGARATP